ncbi:helix-turn-helix domain-containing protein [Hymenobacter sp. ASUV-10]|uniref:Helix-turn-helix domain-containing protein n=1 Tax=Hymenobacter aranciens TaxID=3063996 RepID=A0ABT9B981_9BACT|nr:helix-turn-helix domain-containing protein [Hymenobacter sp. ASUV-10]MDO7874360.1 helix-turn-helix domain-containing protein [Hymenobacter sp. ASUV-10]
MLPTSSSPTAPPFLLLFSQEEYRADLRAILREELRQVLREELAAQAAAPTTSATTSRPAVAALLSVKEAAAFLDVCVASIHAWKRRGLLPYRKLGSRTLFTPEDLLAAVQQPPKLDGRRTTPRRRPALPQ